MPNAPTGTARKLPSGRWQARFYDPDGQRHNAPRTFVTKRDATVYLAQVTADISRGKYTPVAATVAVTFEDYSARWLATRMVKGRPLAGRTLSNYRDLLRHFILPTFANRPIHTISRDDVDKWYAKTGVDIPTSRAKAYSLLRTILASAVADEHLTVNPARIRGAGAVDRQHKVRPATLAELETLTEAIPPRYRLLVQLAAFCALRFGELTELRRGDVDTREGVLRIRRSVVLVDGVFVVKEPKSAAGTRDVAIPAELMPMVRQHLLAHTAPGQDGLLFPSKNDPAEHLRQSSLARVFYPAREAAGRKDLRFHDLRHTGAVLAAQTGGTLAELMQRLGHSTPGAAMRYQHVAAGRDALIASRLSDMIAADRAARQ